MLRELDGLLDVPAISVHSVAEMRRKSGRRLRPHVAHRLDDLAQRSACGSAKLPPYASVRVLVSGERNSLIR